MQLIDASYTGNTNGIRYWLAASANINGRCLLRPNGLAIEYAADGDHARAARLLVARGADTGVGLARATANRSWFTAVVILLHGRAIPRNALTQCMWASMQSGADGVTCLAIRDGADVNAGDPDVAGATPLAFAITSGDAGLADYLVQHGAAVNPAEYALLQPLLKEAAGEQAAMVWLLAGRAHGSASLTGK